MDTNSTIPTIERNQIEETKRLISLLRRADLARFIAWYNGISKEKLKDIDGKGNNLLHHVCQYSSIKIANFVASHHPEFAFQVNEFNNNPLHFASLLGKVDVVTEIVKVLREKNMNLEFSVNQNGFHYFDIEPIKIENILTETTCLSTNNCLQRLAALKNSFRENLLRFTELEAVKAENSLFVIKNRSLFEIVNEDIIQNDIYFYRDEFTPKSLFNGRLYTIIESFWNDSSSSPKNLSFNQHVGQLFHIIMQLLSYYQLTSLLYLGENLYDRTDSSTNGNVSSFATNEEFYDWFFKHNLGYIHTKTVACRGFTEILKTMIDSVNFLWFPNESHDAIDRLKSNFLPNLVNEFLQSQRLSNAENAFQSLTVTTNEKDTVTLEKLESDINQTTTTKDGRNSAEQAMDVEVSPQKLEGELHSTARTEKNRQAVLEKIIQTAGEKSLQKPELLKLMHDNSVNDIAYLLELRKWFKEMDYFQSLIKTSPEDGDHTSNWDLVTALYGDAFVKSTSPFLLKEINKLLIRLLYLRDIIRNDNRRFPSLSIQHFQELREFIIPAIRMEDQLYFLVAALIFDDLGRTSFLQNKVKVFEGSSQPIMMSYDHDEYLKRYFQRFKHSKESYELEDFCQTVPSFLRCSRYYQRIYLNQISNTFNLGAFVQGESVAYSLHQFYVSCSTVLERKYRLIVQILSFTAYRYTPDNFHSIIFDDVHFQQFMNASKIILMNHQVVSPAYTCEVYAAYLRSRGLLLGKTIIESSDEVSEENYALLRILALARASTQQHWMQIRFLWNELPPEDRDTLTKFLNRTGFTTETAIYIYYAPAIISNSIKSFKNDLRTLLSPKPERTNMIDFYGKGVFYAMQELAKIYRIVDEGLRCGKLQACGKTEKIGGVYIYHAEYNADKARRLCDFVLASPRKRSNSSSSSPNKRSNAPKAKISNEEEEFNVETSETDKSEYKILSEE